MRYVYNNLLVFLTVKNFEDRLGFDKVIAVSWVVHFLGHSVYLCMRVCVRI